jgi:peptidoglycan/LPS O-acetylase OafA/YrhL
MDSLPSPETSKTSLSQRYEGLDSFRGFAAFGVVWLHTVIWGTANQDGPSREIIAWLKLRDFSLPLIILSSFFVLTISILRKPESKFSSFFITRFKRLFIPLFIWTSLYCLVYAFVMPHDLRSNKLTEPPTLDVFIGGYMHLWFLQFIFLGSLIVYPVLCWLRTKSEPERTKIAFSFFLGACIYSIIFKLFIQTIDLDNLLGFNPSQNLISFIGQSTKYAFFIPVAIGLGLLSNKINNLYKQNVFRICSLIAVLLSLILHFTLGLIALTAPMYGIAVFIAALQPWKRIPFRLVYISAAYSYGVYILHFFLCEALQVLVFRGKHEFDSIALFSISLLFYVISFGAAFLLRKMIPVDWFIPIVPVRIKISESSSKSTLLPSIIRIYINIMKKESYLVTNEKIRKLIYRTKIFLS